MTPDEPNVSAIWRPTPSSLAYRLAIFNFWYWRFDALVHDRHFTELPADEALAVLPGNRRHCYIFPSYPITEPPASLRRDADRLIYTPENFPNYYVDLKIDGAFEQYLQSFSSKTRSTLKRKVRKFAEASPSGALDWRVARTAEEMATFLDVATNPSERTYQARLLDCALPTEPEFRTSALELASQDMAYGFMLYLGDRPAAYVYSQRHRGIVTYDFLGHAPELNALSPGTVLQYQLLEYMFADPEARVFDFTDRKLCARSIVFPRRVRIRVLVRSHLLLGRFNDWIDLLAERLKSRQHIR